MLLSIILALLVSGLIGVYLRSLWTSYDYFTRRGISGPPHRFFFGHCQDLWSTQSFSKQLQRWTRQYGSIYGLFVGTTPMYVVSDVDFLQEVYIKQFSSFHSRRLPIILRLHTGHKVHLFNATGAQWRRQRNVLNPTFSAAKLKLMSPLVNGCIDTMLEKLAELAREPNAEINIYTLYKRMTMDIICRCAFGIDTNMQNETDNIYLRKSAGTFEVDVDQLSIVKLTNVLPMFDTPFRRFYLSQIAVRRLLIRMMPSLSKSIEETPGSWLTNRVREVVDLRTNALTNSEKRMDLLQLMLDASTHDDIHDDTAKALHSDEVISNVFLFMIAGYETTSTALAYVTYVLATVDGIQQKLVDEIDRTNWETMTRDEFYDRAANLAYLDLFVREVLRMYPITSKGMTRECNTTTNVYGHTIEKGSVIQPDVFTVHYNADLWGPQDPYLFDPERHTVKRHAVAWMPFGIGPRNCVGMRFALMELKMCLIHLLRQYRLLPGEKIEEGFQRQEKLVIQPNAIYVKLEPRSG